MTDGQDELQGPQLQPLSGQVRHLVLLLHGYCADGKDLMPLAWQWRQLLPDALFISANAPEPCDMSSTGHQWFALDIDMNGIATSPVRLRDGARRAAPLLHAFIDRQLSTHDINESAIALVGFSQGAMMAMQVGLRRARPPAAIVSFSGMLLDEEWPDTAAATTSDDGAGDDGAGEKRPALFLAHGDGDEVVPFSAFDMSVNSLRAAGFSVTRHVEHGIGHGIDPQAVALAGAFIHDRLAA